LGFRLAEKNNSSTLLVFAPVYGVASAGTYPKYAPADAPCRRTQIQRNLVELFFSASLGNADGKSSKKSDIGACVSSRITMDAYGPASLRQRFRQPYSAL
jgi:hypothetical protein